MKKEERYRLVQEACYMWHWKPKDVQNYIKKKTGMTVHVESIRVDLNKIKELDRETWSNAGQFGAVHVITELIQNLGMETLDLQNLIHQLHPQELNEETLNYIEQAEGNVKTSLKALISQTKLSKIAGKKAWLYNQLNEQRQFYLDVLESYPLYGAVMRKANESMAEESATIQNRSGEIKPTINPN